MEAHLGAVELIPRPRRLILETIYSSWSREVHHEFWRLVLELWRTVREPWRLLRELRISS
jgi:hypothetical protein